MTVARALVISAMVGSLLLGGRDDFGLDSDANRTAASAPAVSQPLPLVRWEGLPMMVPIGVFCQLFQIGVPSLLQPLGRKREFPLIFGAALLSTFVMYSSLGLAAVAVLRDDIDPSCNLNWSAHRQRTLALVVSIFPAIDCLSVFPMNAIFLSNNLLAVVFQKRWHAGRIDRRTRYACRLLCCVPPLICAFAFPSLAKALGFTGIIGIVLPFIVTPMLHAASLREYRNRWGAAYFDACERDSDFAQYGFSSPAVVKASGAFGALLLAYTVGYGHLHGF